MERSYIRTNLYWFSFSISMETRWRQISLYSSGKVPKPLIFPIVLGKCQITSGHCMQLAGTNIFSNYDKCIDQYGQIQNQWIGKVSIAFRWILLPFTFGWIGKVPIHESALHPPPSNPPTLSHSSSLASTWLLFTIIMAAINHYLLFPRAQILLSIFEYFAWYIFFAGAQGWWGQAGADMSRFQIFMIFQIWFFLRFNCLSFHISIGKHSGLVTSSKCSTV